MREASRVVLCGAVAGLVLFLVKSVMLAMIAGDLLAELDHLTTHPKMPGHYFLIVDLLMGVWVVWLFVAISHRYGAGVRSALLAGGSLWAMKTLQSAHWIGLGFATWDGGMFGAAASSFVGAMTAALAGAVLCRRTGLGESRARG